MRWRVEVIDEALAELRQFSADTRVDFSHIAQMIETHGLTSRREPHVTHLTGPLWEMRMKGRDGIARAAHVTASGRRVVVVHVFSRRPGRRRAEISRSH